MSEWQVVGVIVVLVGLVARSDPYELRVPNAVSFYEEHAFHDNLEDITWFHTHMKAIAESAAKGLCEWFGLEYVEEPKEEEPEPTVERVDVSVRVLAKGISHAISVLGKFDSRLM